MKIVSDKALINTTPDKVFAFLSEPANFEKLLPSDRISDFKSDEKGCSFKAQGSFLIQLEYVEKVPDSVISMKSGPEAPFEFTLKLHLKEMDRHTEGYIDFKGDVNMFMKLLVEKPLLNLFNYMSDSLKQQFQ